MSLWRNYDREENKCPSVTQFILHWAL